MEIMFHYSILDLNAKLVRNHVTLDHIEMIKEQVRELLTNYGPIKALMFDGWDAPWSRLNYDEIPFEDIYRLAKSIQPNCLVMDLNGAKYPSEGLFYSEIKTFEQGAGQKISKDKNFLPSMACYQMQKTWFWKDYMPNEPTKTAEVLVNDNLIPMNKVCCTFILNVAPNTDGLIDDNALKTLKEIGKLWKNDAPQVKVAETGEPIISKNLALGQWVEASWGLDTDIADFATDEKFYTSWRSEPRIKEPWWQVNFRDITSFNTIAITEDKDDMSQYYRIEYRLNGEWKTIFEGEAPTFRRVKIHRFDTVYGDAMRVTFLKSKGNTCVAEMGVYCERR
jgi:alpha-L-fucosidase